MGDIWIIGGANVDICGTAQSDIIISMKLLILQVLR